MWGQQGKQIYFWSQQQRWVNAFGWNITSYTCSFRMIKRVCKFMLFVWGKVYLEREAEVFCFVFSLSPEQSGIFFSCWSFLCKLFCLSKLGEDRWENNSWGVFLPLFLIPVFQPWILTFWLNVICVLVHTGVLKNPLWASKGWWLHGDTSFNAHSCFVPVASSQSP